MSENFKRRDGFCLRHFKTQETDSSDHNTVVKTWFFNTFEAYYIKACKKGNKKVRIFEGIM